ncbi:DUF4032 domain-containing protein [Jonesiaceae bacterium BS-20]|uniref:DUF4032 domain-containing protein n=1 Tax=Jonesiaceae bacterium BS-20 TaxID=3120821 RepID=A0AAU7DVQ7_9MICO
MSKSSLQITSATADPALLSLPWNIPLEEWPNDVLVALPRGISRHIVRFVRLSGEVIAVKEIGEVVAFSEYELLRQLSKTEIPSVEPVGVITGRKDKNGERLEAVLITKHLQFSLPYRSLYSQNLQPDTSSRLVDALAVLMVRLHLIGFYWGDVSLSNTLFRRDAETFAAWLVDAETGRLYPKLTDGQRNYDIELARTNIIGELMDLQAGEFIDEEEDVIDIGDRLFARYNELWSALHDMESFDADESWRVSAHIEHLNSLGFDVDELEMTTDIDGTTIMIQPKVVDAGHHARRLMHLTGLDVQENQARRLINDLESYRAMSDRQNDEIEFVAHDWLANVFEPAIQAVPRDQRRKLEPAQLYHEILDHRWYMSEKAQYDVPMDQVVASYVENVLRKRPDEMAVLGLAPDEAHLQE